MTITDFKKSKEIVKLEIIFNKSVENSGKSDKNCTTLRNPYYLVLHIWNCTIRGIILSEFELSGDPLYHKSSILLDTAHYVLLEHYYAVDFPWWFDRKIRFFLNLHSLTQRPSGTLLFSGLPMMIWQKNKFCVVSLAKPLITWW